MMRHTLRLCPGLTEQASGMAGPPAASAMPCCRPAANGELVRGREDRPGGGSSYAYKQIHYLSNDARRSVCVGAPLSGI